MSPASAEGAERVPSAFAPSLIAWQRVHGRSGLPWQGTHEPYVVWLSEVMLQQTQVSTVLTYFPRFLARFPHVQALAEASSDEVMALWSGLGYYSRARNLHRCAQAVVAQHGGSFPRSVEALAALPGIGPSTAAAIAAFCFGERVSILDGNVRRVLTRLLAFAGDQSEQGAQRELWSLAQALVPAQASHADMTAYVQGLMDLGATVCTRSRPTCLHCPVVELCRAHASGSVALYPVKTRKIQRRHETWWLLMISRTDSRNGLQWWLVRRPAKGIWAGMYCPPVFATEGELLDALGPTLHQRLRALDAVSHSLTHRELRLQPLQLDWTLMESDPLGSKEGQWVDESALVDHGLPTPVRHLLTRQA
jgi:A/G-specific adenine glycosylase